MTFRIGFIIHTYKRDIQMWITKYDDIVVGSIHWKFFLTKAFFHFEKIKLNVGYYFQIEIVTEQGTSTHDANIQCLQYFLVVVVKRFFVLIMVG